MQRLTFFFLYVIALVATILGLTFSYSLALNDPGTKRDPEISVPSMGTDIKVVAMVQDNQAAVLPDAACD